MKTRNNRHNRMRTNRKESTARAEKLKDKFLIRAVCNRTEPEAIEASKIAGGRILHAGLQGNCSGRRDIEAVDIAAAFS